MLALVSSVSHDGLLPSDVFAVTGFPLHLSTDADYRGNVGVILFNFSDTDFVGTAVAAPSCHQTRRLTWCARLPTVKRGDRIAQLILEKCSTPDVTVVDELPDSSRYVLGRCSCSVLLDLTPVLKQRRWRLWVHRCQACPHFRGEEMMEVPRNGGGA